MDAASPKQFGITGPLSTEKATPKQIQLSEAMTSCLKTSGFFESEDESRRRERVLGALNQLVKAFIVEIGLQKNMSREDAELAGGKIFTFGSYRLGVHSTGADLDTLCVAPSHVERSDFFGAFFERLRKQPEVTNLTQVPDAYVPVIKMCFDGIHIDLVFARLMLPVISEDLDLLDLSLLKSLDEKCVLSLNGSRVTDEILKLVPNVASFHSALRCIKYWAKRRGLYSNSMGYLGGVAYALLVARVCQLYPNAAPFTIVQRFFHVFKSWNWPQPVILKNIEESSLQMKVWNPRQYPADRYHKMPVITPAYPSMCSTHNVSASTLQLIMAEFRRGCDICLAIENGTATWDTLFAKSDFFSEYKNYFQILAYSTDEETAKVWFGFVESKIRFLTLKLEQVSNISAAPPFPDSFERQIKAQDISQVFAEHCSIEKPAENAQGPECLYYTLAFFVGVQTVPMTDQQNPNAPKKLYLERPVEEFKDILRQWDKLNADMKFMIRILKRSELPEYVYQGGARPSKLKRPRKTISQPSDQVANGRTKQ